MASLKKRGNRYQVQYYVGKQQRRISLGDVPYQVAKEKLRQFESAQFRGDDMPTVTQTPIAEVVAAYVDHIRAHKTAKSAQTDVYYLRDAFGPICDQLGSAHAKWSQFE
jgi:thioesterase domain-containing protein